MKQSVETSRELIRDFLKQPAGEYLLTLIHNEIQEFEEERIDKLTMMTERTDFDAQAVDDVVNKAQQVKGMEHLLDKIKEDVRLEDEQDPGEDL